VNLRQKQDEPPSQISKVISFESYRMDTQTHTHMADRLLYTATKWSAIKQTNGYSSGSYRPYHHQVCIIQSFSVLSPNTRTVLWTHASLPPFPPLFPAPTASRSVLAVLLDSCRD